MQTDLHTMMLSTTTPSVMSPTNATNRASVDAGVENLWLKILSEVGEQSRASRYAKRHIVLLGDAGVGKNTLAAALKMGGGEIEGPTLARNTLLIGHNWITIKDDVHDEVSHVDVWMLDQPECMPLLFKHAIGCKSKADLQQELADTIFCFVVSMSRPWLALQSLKRWSAALQQQLIRLDVDANYFGDLSSKREEEFRTYADPAVERPSDEKVGVPHTLNGDVLTVNLGVQLMVIMNKSDLAVYLEKELDWKARYFDFLQLHLRRWALRHGAGLIYTSTKNARNCGLFLKYIGHRLFASAKVFAETAHILERDDVFIPVGWDSESKISVLLVDGIGDGGKDADFERALTPTAAGGRAAGGEAMDGDSQTDDELEHATPDNEQEFLRELQSLLAVGSNKSPAKAGTARTTPSGAELNSTLSAAASGATSSTPVKKASTSTPASAGSSTSDATLSEFFNTLLQKKPSTASPSTGNRSRRE